MLDEQKVQDWIESLRSELTERIHDKRVNDELETPGYYRLNGAMNFLAVLKADIKTGGLNADVPEPTPVKDIKVRTQNIVRAKDPSTSWEAAIQQTSEKRQDLYIKIRAGLHAMGPSTDEMLADFVATAWPRYKFSPSGLRTRRSELVQAGWVKADGKKKLRNGNLATAWVRID